MARDPDYLLEATPYQTTPAARPSARTGRVLVVDDDDDVRTSLAAVLEQDGHVVRGVADGTAALDALHHEEFDVLLVDLRLEGDLDGLSILKEAVEQRPELVGIVLTGYASLESSIQALDAGAFSYLLKPCNLGQLRAAILRGLDRQAMSHSLRELERAAVVAAQDRAEAAVRDAHTREQEAHAMAERATARVRHLQGITAQLGGDLATEALLERVVRAAIELLETPTAAVFRLDPHRGDFQLAAAEGLDGSKRVRLSRWRSLAGRALRQRSTLAINDVRRVRNVELPTLGDGARVGSLAVAPIWDADTAIGVIEVYTPKAHDWLSDELDLLTALAAAAGVAMVGAQRREQLLAATRTRDEVLASVTHDLRTPLTTISGLAQLLQRGLDASEEPRGQRLRSGLGNIHKMAQTMARLIDELMDTVKVQLGEPVALDYADVDLAALLRDAVEAVRSMDDGHEIVLDAPESLSGRWDYRRLERLVHNLLSNAVKYSPSHSRVIVTATIDRGDAVLTVQDFGIGIKPADMPYIFEPFKRGENVGEAAGTGLGLLSVKRVCELHGGTVSVTSEEGRGSTFTVRLPLQLRSASGRAG